MKKKLPDIYGHFGVTFDTPLEAVKGACRCVILKNHPDLAGNDEGERAKREHFMKILNPGADLLKDPKRHAAEAVCDHWIDLTQAKDPAQKQAIQTQIDGIKARFGLTPDEIDTAWRGRLSEENVKNANVTRVASSPEALKDLSERLAQDPYQAGVRAHFITAMNKYQIGGTWLRAFAHNLTVFNNGPDRLPQRNEGYKAIKAALEHYPPAVLSMGAVLMGVARGPDYSTSKEAQALCGVLVPCVERVLSHEPWQFTPDNLKTLYAETQYPYLIGIVVEKRPDLAEPVTDMLLGQIHNDPQNPGNLRLLNAIGRAGALARPDRAAYVNRLYPTQNQGAGATRDGAARGRQPGAGAPHHRPG